MLYTSFSPGVAELGLGRGEPDGHGQGVDGADRHERAAPADVVVQPLAELLVVDDTQVQGLRHRLQGSRAKRGG